MKKYFLKNAENTVSELLDFDIFPKESAREGGLPLEPLQFSLAYD